MSMTRTERLTDILLQVYPSMRFKEVLYFVKDLTVAAGRLHTIACRQCNGYRDDAAQARDEKAEAKVETTVRKACEAFPGIVPVFGGDPRGCVLKIKIPGVPGDGWGGGEDGHPVYSGKN